MKTIKSDKHRLVRFGAKNINSLSDKQLYSLCKSYGINARLWLRKFAGLLPEVNRRKLYKKRGCVTIYEFAAKLGGMSHASTDRILRLADRLADKPLLSEQLTAGSVGWSKLEKVSYIATKGTDKEWAEKVEMLPMRGLEQYVKEYRLKSVLKNTPENEPAPYRINSGILFSTHITPDIMAKLKILKQQFEKSNGETLSWNEVLSKLLDLHNSRDSQNSRDSRNSQTTKQKIVETCKKCTTQKMDDLEFYGLTKRQLPAVVKKIVDARSNGRCEFPNCTNPKESYHHTRRFSLRSNHDPEFIMALCAPHERIAHVGLIENEEKNPMFWEIKNRAEQNSNKFKIDQKVISFRTEVAAGIEAEQKKESPTPA